jgi:sugar lactone lactonase YvrE
MPTEPGCIAPAQTGGLVLALRHGVFRARTWGGALEPLAVLPYDTATVRANDGKCDALGRFWVGTIDEPKASHAAALFSIDARAAGAPLQQQQAADALTGNGLAWAPDNGTVYWSDTPNHIVHAWDYALDANTLSAHRTHLQFAPKPAGWTFQDASYQGRPDGAAVDVQGNYWVSMFEGARICQFAPGQCNRARWACPRSAARCRRRVRARLFCPECLPSTASALAGAKKAIPPVRKAWDAGFARRGVGSWWDS